MIFGLTGASGTGKTTVGKLVADALDMKFQPTSISACAKAHGFDPVAVLSLSDRMVLQGHLLADHIKLITTTPTPVILDRTPIDMAGYMIAEMSMHSHVGLSTESLDWICDYVDACMKATQLYYDYVFHLCPLPTYEQASTRPPLNKAYQRHYDLVVAGVISRISGRINVATVDVTDLQTRVDFIHDTIVQRLDKLEKHRNTSAHVH